MYKVIFTDRKGVRREVSGITLSDCARILIKASIIEPFQILEYGNA